MYRASYRYPTTSPIKELLRQESLTAAQQDELRQLMGSDYLHNATDGKLHRVSAVASGATIVQSVDQVGEWISADSVYTGLLAYWRLDEAAPSGDVQARDSCGLYHLNSNNSVLSTDSGKTGRARVFDPANEERLMIASGSHPFAFGDADWTFGAWVYLTDLSHDSIIGGVFKSSGDNRGWMVLYDQSEDRFRAYINDDGTASGSSFVDADTFGSPSADTWYFVRVSYDATANDLAISVDNGTADSVAHSGGVYASADSAFRLGNNDNLGVGDYLEGRVDEVGIWSKVLSAEELTRVYNAGTLPT